MVLQETSSLFRLLYVCQFKWIEALCLMDGRFVVPFDMCMQCHSSFMHNKSDECTKNFVFQFYLNLRLAAIENQFVF